MIASLPPRERGLKQTELQIKLEEKKVAPSTGAWIETYVRKCQIWQRMCRSLHGSVD